MSYYKITKSVKDMTEDELWKYCIDMWRWIAKQPLYKSVVSLKLLWLKKHGIYNDILIANCFFCAKAGLSAYIDCECPAKKVDAMFRCNRPEYHYDSNRLAFYNKLLELNSLRKQQAKQHLSKKGDILDEKTITNL